MRLWENGGMWFPDREVRRELYQVAALTVSAVALSHALGYWPQGAAPVSANQQQAILGAGMNWGEFAWRIVFIASLLTVATLYYLGRKQQPTGDNSGSRGAAALHEARADEFKQQVETLTKERGDLLSEVARLNQHRVDLLGKQVLDVHNSPSTNMVVVSARTQLASLSMPQRMALKVVYDQPGLQFDEIAERLKDVIEPKAAIAHIMHTNLVDTTRGGIFNPASNPHIAKEAEDFVGRLRY
jgi:hypothetical protein